MDFPDPNQGHSIRNDQACAVENLLEHAAVLGFHNPMHPRHRNIIPNTPLFDPLSHAGNHIGNLHGIHTNSQYPERAQGQEYCKMS